MNEFLPDKLDNKLSPELKEKAKKNIATLKKALFNPDINFFFVPSAKLRALVSGGTHPVTKKLPDGFKALILSGKPHAIQKRMVFDFLTGELDSGNKFILENGDIRVLQGNVSLLNEGEIDGKKGN